MNKKYLVLFSLIFILLVASLSYSVSYLGTSTEQSKGLVGHWSLAQKDLSSITQVEDLTPTNANGTLVHAPVSATDRHGQPNNALDFDGSNDYITFGDNANFDFERTDLFSVFAWVKSESVVSPTDDIVSKMDHLAPFNGWSFWILGADGSIEVGIINSTSTVNLIDIKGATDIENDNTWHLVGFTYNGNSSASGINIYVDGLQDKPYTTLTDALTGDISGNVNPVNIGARNNQARFFDGDISDVRIYERVVSASEALAMYEGYNPKIEIPSTEKGLVSGWSLQEKDLKNATIIADSTPSNNNGTVVGAIVGKTKTTFDGSTSYIELSNTSFLTDHASDTVGSISIWFNQRGSNEAMFSLSNGTNEFNDIRLFVAGSGLIAFRLSTASSIIIDLGSDVTGYGDSAWHHVVITQDGITSLMYVDGILQVDTDSGEWLNDLNGLSNFIIGARYNNNQTEAFWDGDISEVRYCDRALTAQEAKQLYDSGRLGSGLEIGSIYKGLKGDWSLQEKDLKNATIIADSTPSNNNGTVVGAIVGKTKTTFDGSFDYIDISDNLDPSGTAGTIVAYTKRTAANVNDGIFGWWDGDEGLFIQSQTAGDGYAFVVGGASTTGKITVNTTGKWNCIVAVYDGTAATDRLKMKMYFNGELITLVSVGTIPSSISVSLPELRIGDIGNGTLNRHWTGDLKNIKYYARALTAQEASQACAEVDK